MTLRTPRTLRGRLILLIIAALAFAQVLTLWLFIDQRALAIRSALALEAADRAGNLVRLLDGAPAALRPEILRAANSALVQFTLGDRPEVTHVDHPGNLNVAARVRRQLGDDPRHEIRVEIHHTAAPMPTMPGAPSEMGQIPRLMSPPGMSSVELNLSISLADGRWLNMASRFHNPPYQWVWSEVATFVVTAALLGVVLWLALGRIVDPLRRLADAADRIGRGEDSQKMDLTGPEEMQRLAQAFNEMQDRLHRFVSERTRLLGALGHDLRSPLTALRVRAEMVDDEETRDRMIATIGEMQEMVDATLSFARGMTTHEAVEDVDLSDFVAALVGEYRDAGHEIRLDRGVAAMVRLRPTSMRRAIRNLIENALRYGGGVCVSVGQGDGAVLLVIEDEGPGIPPESLEKVFHPFVRLEGSRSRETGGAGLGLSIARTIVHAHGGEITLSNRPACGLRAEISLPGPAAPSPGT